LRLIYLASGDATLSQEYRWNPFHIDLES
jgi:hypothetical protein